MYWCTTQKVKKGLVKVFWSLISADEAEDVLELVLYSQDLEVNCHLFSCISCVARRVLCLYDKYVCVCVCVCVCLRSSLIDCISMQVGSQEGTDRDCGL